MGVAIGRGLVGEVGTLISFFCVTGALLTVGLGEAGVLWLLGLRILTEISTWLSFKVGLTDTSAGVYGAYGMSSALSASASTSGAYSTLASSFGMQSPYSKTIF